MMFARSARMATIVLTKLPAKVVLKEQFGNYINLKMLLFVFTDVVFIFYFLFFFGHITFYFPSFINIVQRDMIFL